METENRTMVIMMGREKNAKLFNRNRVSVLQNKKGDGDG